jgi:catechol 2,3-dioxygenase-like lactoylglutathione lyase family enzyme
VKVTRILHHSVNVQGGLDAATAFYRQFSLPDADRPTIPGVEGHWFTVGGAQVHLVDAPTGPPPDIQPTGPHVCFGVEDLDAAVAELEGSGTPYLRALQGDVVQIWIVDPSGNTVELQQDPAVGR